MNRCFRLTLPYYLALFQILFILSLAIFVDYDINEKNKEVPGLYSMFMDVHSMMFLGFGFLMTFLKKYGYSSVGYNFLVAAFVLEWAILSRGLVDSWLGEGNEKNGSFKINIENLLEADFCAAAILISFGAVIGKTTITQLIVMATFEVAFQSINEYIGVHYLKAYDIGESMFVHVFGAYFGLAVSKVLHHKTVKSNEEEANYHSDLFAMIGTLILWLYWPSFNSAVAKEEGQLRAVINTYISIVSSCISTFIVSSIVGKGKLNMVQVQNATLAGGVAIGAVADMSIYPYAAAFIGSIVGVISTLGFQYLTEFLNHKLKLHDTCGVNNLHGIPGLLSGVASIIVAATASRDKYNGNRLYIFYPSLTPKKGSEDYVKYNLSSSSIPGLSEGGLGRTTSEQALFQIAALCMTFVAAIVTGLAVGGFLKLPFFEQTRDDDKMFIDNNNWILPADFFDSSNNEKVRDEVVDNEATHSGSIQNPVFQLSESMKYE